MGSQHLFVSSLLLHQPALRHTVFNRYSIFPYHYKSRIRTTILKESKLPSQSSKYLETLCNVTSFDDEEGSGGIYSIPIECITENDDGDYESSVLPMDEDYEDYENSILPTAADIMTAEVRDKSKQQLVFNKSVSRESNNTTGISVELPPNEELPIPIEGEYEDVWLDSGNTPKFDMELADIIAADRLASTPVKSFSKRISSVENEDFRFNDKKTSNGDSSTATAGPIKRLQNLLSGHNEDKVREETERARKWKTWMAFGRKVREASDLSTQVGSSMDSSEKISLVPDIIDETLLSVKKGQEYVVVAVPAEAANGVGPVLTSFPGGKLFQKTIGKTLQDIASFPDAINGESIGGVGSNKNDTSTPSASIDEIKKKNTRPTIEIKKKKKKKPHRKQKKKLSNKNKQHKKDPKKEGAEQKKKRLQERHYREERWKESGRISAGDWRHNMINLPSSTILRDIRNPVAAVFLWATVWSIIHKWLTGVVAATFEYSVSSGVALGTGSSTVALGSHWVQFASWFGQKMWLPAVQHSMMVSAMSLLLVFRTNSAYQRFAEGRKIWNDIVDTARDFSRMVKLYEFAIGREKCRRINALLASFPYLLRHRIRPSLMTFYRVNDMNIERDKKNSLMLYPDESLRDTDTANAVIAYDEEERGSSRRQTRELCWVDKRTLPWKLIPGTALDLCARAQNRPLWVCDRMAKELAMVEDCLPLFTNRERLALIAYVDKLSRSIGSCERIHQTVVPLNYARHALRSLTVWLWTLPFVLVKDLGLFTGPVVAVVSWILFGVYEIGSRIEDPFQGTLRLSIYCDAIRRDVLADAIARDTAFDLDEEGNFSADDGEYDAIIELESESDEYANDGTNKTRQKKKVLGWAL